MAAVLPLAQTLALKLMGAVVAMLAIVAAADYLFQYRQWYERQKMSLQELKEEFKQTEGDPVIKGKMKQVRQFRQRRRMMQAVPKAAVVITNPTHYAIALRIRARHGGADLRGQGRRYAGPENPRSRRQAFGPIVENPPLARALHATVEIDEAIPPEHYKAVAEVIGYVMKMRRAVPRDAAKKP